MTHIENVGHYSIIRSNGEDSYPLGIASGYGALAYSKTSNTTFGKTGLSDITNALEYARRMTASNPNSTLVPYFN